MGHHDILLFVISRDYLVETLCGLVFHGSSMPADR